MKKKILFLVVSSILITSISFGYTKISDLKSEEVPVSTGVTYQNIKRFTTGGWLNINVLRADLTNEYVKIDMLTPTEGIYNLQTIREQAAATSNTVAAVNADFFSWTNGKINGVPVGFGMKNGEITSGMYYKNAIKDTMATFSLNSSNIPFYNYIRSQSITVSNSKGETAEIVEINKTSNDYIKPVIFNKYWNNYSMGNTQFWDMVEFVVENDKLKEIRDCKEPVEIPENGYVISARLDEAYNLKCLFNVGDKIKLDIKTDADMSGMITALSGGTMLVENGKTLEGSFTHDISGYQPRTAVGTSKDNKILYIVAVDGRGVSKGVTQIELAYLMNELGCYRAINFDGGGSTIMLGHLAGTEGLSTLNNPTDNRKVVNGLGILSTAPKTTTMGGLILSSSDDYVFVDNAVTLSVKGYDENVNTVSINQNDVKWTVTGVKGTVKNGEFKATTSGVAILKATYKGVSATIKVTVLGDIGEINLGEREVFLAEGQTYSLPITVRDVEGYSAFYEASKLKFTVSNENCSIDETGKIVAKKIGSTLVTVQAPSGTKSFVKINVTGEVEESIENFDELNVTFRAYPSDSVDGKVKLSTTKHEGSKSLQLYYDFTGTNNTRGAYAVFDSPIILDNTSTKIKFWAMSKATRKDVMIKVEIEDNNGETKLLMASDGIDNTKWNQYEVLLDNINLPAKLNRIYVAQVQGKKGVDSSIFIDDVTLCKKSDATASNIVLPGDTRPTDLSERHEDLQDGGISFMVYGDATYSNTLYDAIRKRRLEDVGGNVDFVVLANGNIESAKEELVLNGKYAFYEEGNTAVIKLANSGTGLLATYTEQWNWLVEKLNTIKAKNLFVVMPEVLESSFNDLQEKALFREALETYQDKHDANITFIVPNGKCGVSMYEGMKNIFVGTKKYDNIKSMVYNDKYILFTVNGDKITYEILAVM